MVVLCAMNWVVSTSVTRTRSPNFTTVAPSLYREPAEVLDSKPAGQPKPVNTLFEFAHLTGSGIVP